MNTVANGGSELLIFVRRAGYAVTARRRVALSVGPVPSLALVADSVGALAMLP